MKKLIIVLGILVVLLGGAYFVVTSSGFLKAVVLPRVGAALDARVEASSIALRPWSSVEIRQLTVVPNGADPLVSVEMARVQYRLGAILKGQVVLDEIVVMAPTLTLVSRADGTSNLDPILKRLAEGAGAPPPAEAGPLQLDLRRLQVERGVLRYRGTGADGSETVAEVTGLTASARDLRNAGNGRVDVSGAVGLDQRAGPGGGGASGTARGRLEGGFDVGLTAELQPGSVNGRVEFRLDQAGGVFEEFQGFSAVLGTELTPTELRRLGVEFARQGAALGAVRAQGPLDLAKGEGNLQVDVAGIDRQVLNLAGAAYGLDFTTTRLDSTNRIEIADANRRITVVGSLTGSRVSVRQADLTLPPVDFRGRYDVAVDLGAASAAVRVFALNASQSGREVLRGTLSQPMEIRWAADAGAVPDAAVSLVVQDLRLADWSALMGAPWQGTVQAQAELGVTGGGKDLALKANAALAGVTGMVASNEVRQLALRATADARISAFADPVARKVAGNLKIEELTGTAAVVTFDRYGAEATFDIGLPEGAVALNDVQVRLRQGSQDGGLLTLRGRWDVERGAGELSTTATGVNEAGLRPFLQPALGERRLQKVQVSADGTVRLQPDGESLLRGTAELKDLMVTDPSGKAPPGPLSAGAGIEVAGKEARWEIRRGDLRLERTARAANEAQLTGHIDLSNTDAVSGALRLASQALDVTPYFNLFYDAPATTASTPPPAAPPPAGPTVEPEPMGLPIGEFRFDVDLAAVYLREVIAENVRAGVRIRGSEVEIPPFEWRLNGAPVTGAMKVNVGVPGYEYQMRAQAGGVPVRPLANSFAPLLKDRIEGAANAGLEVKGAGITGVNLRQNLTGGMQFAVTNANLRLQDAASQRGLLSLLTRVLANALNIRELQDQPIMDLVADAKFGEGKIAVTEGWVRSASFEARMVGDIPIADDLMHSPLNFPVRVGLRRELAQRARLVPADAPTNAVYVAIPDIASVKGTLGAPAPEVDKVRTALLVARGVGGLVGGQAGGAVGGVADLVGGVAAGGSNVVGNLIQGIGGLLGGGRTGTTNVAGTNTPPATNPPPRNPLGGLLRGILEPERRAE